ncbi:uncharacterized protein BDZ99DRAFT_515534 [Mytilinidion resinicola]|uniref:Uncharacterized protein n=1 Tax=Mytilinidion resinicola TaxID=574789 RepID=A0A6A6Z1S9_9PEZI|nr:uncharacterized protein BDZ99DRAFT_515534 [Mytilinidion resinicola]KAF2814758.1 hypothetical protein BDZ99DRAFT_515534 [Mytilinidion resinicola]
MVPVIPEPGIPQFQARRGDINPFEHISTTPSQRRFGLASDDTPSMRPNQDAATQRSTGNGLPRTATPAENPPAQPRTFLMDILDEINGRTPSNEASASTAANRGIFEEDEEPVVDHRAHGNPLIRVQRPGTSVPKISAGLRSQSRNSEATRAEAGHHYISQPHDHVSMSEAASARPESSTPLSVRSGTRIRHKIARPSDILPNGRRCPSPRSSAGVQPSPEKTAVQ